MKQDLKNHHCFYHLVLVLVFANGMSKQIKLLLAVQTAQ